MATSQGGDPELLSKYITCAEFLIQKCASHEPIHGANKLGRKCAAELKYLKSLPRRRGGYDVTHVKSSNLSHYTGVLHAVEHLPEVTHVLQPFPCPGRSDPLYMDVVAGQGHVWVKVIARKAQALHLIWGGQGQFGEKDIVLQAEDYLTCRQSHPVNFVDPILVFAFYSGVTKPIAHDLKSLGIVVLGEEVDVDPEVERKINESALDSSDSDDEIESGNGTDDDCESVDNDVVQTRASLSFRSCISKDDEHSENGGNKSSADKARNFAGTDMVSVDECSHAPFTTDEKCVLNENSIAQNGVNQASASTEICSVLDKLAVTPATNSSDSLLRPNVDIRHCAPGIKNHESHKRDAWTSVDDSMLAFIKGGLLISPLADFSPVREILSENAVNNVDRIQKVNLDITALITMVSAVSHGRCYFRFREKILSEQAEEERAEPVMPSINRFIEGKELYTCQTAADSFQGILETLGGEGEKLRAVDLMSRVNVVPDNPSFRTLAIPNTGKIKNRSKVIFGTGDSLQAVTLTANSGFVRAAHHQGVLFAVYTHASRALTEEKEVTAEPIPSET